MLCHNTEQSVAGNQEPKEEEGHERAFPDIYQIATLDGTGASTHHVHGIGSSSHRPNTYPDGHPASAGEDRALGIERNIPVLETKEQIFARRRPGPLDTAVQSVPGTLGVPTILVGFEGLGPASRRSVIGVAVPAGAG